MVYIIMILFAYGYIMTIKYVKMKNKNKINYSNYRNCLRALADTDSDLKNYLVKEGKY